MVTKDEAIKAAETLQKYCAEQGEDHEGCAFWRNGWCNLWMCTPRDWRIPRTSRWTDTDVKLAKALKKAGADKVFRTRTGEFVLWQSVEQRGYLPVGAFDALSKDEVVALDTIIQEAKEA